MCPLWSLLPYLDGVIHGRPREKKIGYGLMLGLKRGLDAWPSFLVCIVLERSLDRGKLGGMCPPKFLLGLILGRPREKKIGRCTFDGLAWGVCSLVFLSCMNILGRGLDWRACFVA